MSATETRKLFIQAVDWVRKRWRNIHYVAKDELRPHEKRGPGGHDGRSAGAPPRSVAVDGPRFRWIRQAKLYYHRPEQATKRIAFAEAYVPWEVDLQGQYATADEVENMAHDFMIKGGKAGEMHARWVLPDGALAGHTVQSFIARQGDPDFVPGAWVVGTKYHPEVWEGILAGRYKGVSIGGQWNLRPVDVRLAAVLEEDWQEAA
jgi:hypothetical protein